MTDSQFTQAEWLVFAAEIEARATAFAERTGKRDAAVMVMASASAATIRHLAPGGLAATGTQIDRSVPRHCPTCGREVSGAPT